MAAVHTEAAAIFNSQPINEVEDKIQYVKYQFGNPITTSNTLSSSTPTARFRRNVVKEVDDNDEEEEEEEDMDQEEEEEDEEKPKKATRAVPSDPRPFPTSARDIQEYLDEAEHRYIKWQRALTSFKNETNVQ